MIVSCPACEIRFEVDQEQLGYDGRVVRCGKCGNCWHQMPDKDPRSAVVEEAPPPPRRSAPPKPRRGGRGVAVGWVLLLLLIAGLGAGGWFGREQIVAQVPQMADVYALIGIPVTPPGPVLKLSDINVSSETVNGDSVVSVRGVVTNISERKQPVPALRAQVTNAAGEVLVEWTFEPPQSELDAGAVTAFETETRNPPAGARDINISLVGEGH